MTDSPHSDDVALDLVADAIIAHTDLPKPDQRASKPLAVSGWFNHQASLHRPHDARTEISWDAWEIFGRNFWPIYYRVAITHRLLDPEPPLDFRVWDRSRWVLPTLIDDLLQGRVF